MESNENNHDTAVSPALAARNTLDEVLKIAGEARERVRTLAAASEETSARPGSAVDEELAAMGASDAMLSERVYRRAREVIQDAYENAAEVRLDALRHVESQLEKTERQASELLSGARVEAEAGRAQAVAEARLLLQRAQRDADAIIADAREQFVRITLAASEEAVRIRTEAESEAAELKKKADLGLAEAGQRSTEAARLEAEFDRAAREFVKWLGLESKPEQKLFGRVLHRSR
jgi:vacuolar-type H+-ATPase subunit H